jgi:hypothetical protein
LPKNSKISLELQTKEIWNELGLIQVKYQNDFNEIQFERCERTNNLNSIKCFSPSWNKACNVSISLSLSNGSFVSSQMKLKIFDNDIVKFNSISPSTIDNSIQLITIQGESFMNFSTIKIKYSNHKMEEILTSKLMEENKIVSPPPSSFFFENVVYPLVLNVAVSFDNGISFTPTNMKIQVKNFGKHLELTIQRNCEFHSFKCPIK